MQCDDVAGRLVAWRDGELGASEHRQVEEHVRRCAACAEADRRLRAALPRRPRLAPPPDIVARLDRALDPARLQALADRPAAPARRVGWAARWRHPIPVSAGAALVYLVLLAGTFGWGLSNWWSLRASAPSLQTSVPGPGIPADQFRPASYAPGSGPDGRSAPGAPSGR